MADESNQSTGAASTPPETRVLHFLITHKGRHNAVVVHRQTLARLLGYDGAAIDAAIDKLAADHWIQRIGLGDAVDAYVVNERVNAADDAPASVTFTAQVIVDGDALDAATFGDTPLRKIPDLFDDA